MSARMRGGGGEIPALACGVSNRHPWKPGAGQGKAGGLTGAVASQKVTEAREGPLTAVGNRGASARA